MVFLVSYQYFSTVADLRFVRCLCLHAPACIILYNIIVARLFYIILAGLPGFARDSCSIIMSICAFQFYSFFHFFSADHGIPQSFDYILTT